MRDNCVRDNGVLSRTFRIVKKEKSGDLLLYRLLVKGRNMIQENVVV